MPYPPINDNPQVISCTVLCNLCAGNLRHTPHKRRENQATTTQPTHAIHRTLGVDHPEPRSLNMVPPYSASYTQSQRTRGRVPLTRLDTMAAEQSFAVPVSSRKMTAGTPWPAAWQQQQPESSESVNYGRKARVARRKVATGEPESLKTNRVVRSVTHAATLSSNRACGRQAHTHTTVHVPDAPLVKRCFPFSTSASVEREARCEHEITARDPSTSFGGYLQLAMSSFAGKPIVCKAAIAWKAGEPLCKSKRRPFGVSTPLVFGVRTPCENLWLLQP
jgi:hypothetical protein